MAEGREGGKRLDLTWCECAAEPLLEGYVEVEVEAVGVNFKVS